MEGEFDARINNADTLVTRNPEWLAKGVINLHAIMEVPKGLKHDHFASLPEVEQFAQSDRERKVLAMVRAFRQVGSPYILPPGTPADEVKILREALVKTFNDPSFHKEYKKLTGDDAGRRLCRTTWKKLSRNCRGIEKLSSCLKRSGRGFFAAALVKCNR